MANETIGLFWMTESPLHAGAGATLSAIDLPIQRETHTGNPVVYGSGIKGGLRELKADGKGKLPAPYEAIFGPESDRASEHAGIGVFSEARVILFPVATTRGIFVWVTCPAELHRFKRDLLAISDGLEPPARTAAQTFQALNVPNPGVVLAAAPQKCIAALNGSIYLDEAQPLRVDANATSSAEAIARWFSEHALPADSEYAYWRTLALDNIVVVHNEEYQHLVRYATHVEIHVKIGESGTVAEGPWSEESIPADAVLYSSVILQAALGNNVRDKLQGRRAREWFDLLLDQHPRLQICGLQSVGKGWVRPRRLS